MNGEALTHYLTTTAAAYAHYILSALGVLVMVFVSKWARKALAANQTVIAEILGTSGTPKPAEAEQKSLREMVRETGTRIEAAADVMQTHREETRAAFVEVNRNVMSLDQRMGGLDSRVQSLDGRVQSMEAVVMQGHEQRISNLESDLYRNRTTSQAGKTRRNKK